MKLKLSWAGVRLDLDTDDLDEHDGPEVEAQMMREVARELRKSARAIRDDAKDMRRVSKDDEADMLLSTASRYEATARNLDRCRRDGWER